MSFVEVNKAKLGSICISLNISSGLGYCDGSIRLNYAFDKMGEDWGECTGCVLIERTPSDSKCFNFTIHLYPHSPGRYRLSLYGDNLSNKSHASYHDTHRSFDLVPIYSQELVFREDVLSSFIVPPALCNIWGIINGQVHGKPGYENLKNESECCVINPTEGLILIEATNYPRFLNIVSWRNDDETEVFTKTQKASDLPETPQIFSPNDYEDPYVDDEESSDFYVSHTLKFPDPGLYVVEVYGVAMGKHPLTANPVKVIELIGQFLIHLSRHGPQADGGPKKKGKKSKGKSHASGDDQICAEAINQQESAPPIKITFLDPAPSSFSLPATVPACKKAKDGTHIQASPEVTSDSKRPASEVTMPRSGDVLLHTDQPVDAEARRLAQDIHTRAACWRDLYWHLVASRQFKTDEEKVRALFTWLCSIPPNMQPFPVLESESGDGLKQRNKGKYHIDSPDAVLPKLVEGKANYVQAFESMLRYSGIPCVTIRGIAKSMDYKVGQPLLQKDEPLFHPETGALPPQIASLQHSWNAAYVDGSWRLYDCTWAAQRLAMGAREGLGKSGQAVALQYETDMFYYQVDPCKLIYTHYPFEDVWQLIEPPISIVNFATWPLIKPAFFQYGLSLFSHQEGTVAVENKLVLKLKILPENINKLLFTYQLNLEGHGNIDVGASKTRFGMHEVSPEESCVVFHFRLPKKGDYNLVIYARHAGEQLFSDVCEYRVTAKGKEGDDGVVGVMPFPPTAQANYGPTEKALEYGLETLPRGLHPLIKSPKGTVEIRFIAADIENPIPRLTARLKSISVKPEQLENCVLLRDIEASMPTTGVSVLTGTGPCVPMSVLNAYLPEPGEYALEVYAAPAGSDEEPTAYHLAWQFLIEAEIGKPLSAPLMSRLATINLGPQDDTWQKMGFRALSHPDPLVHVRTAGRAGSERLLRVKNKSQLLQRFVGLQAAQSQAAAAAEAAAGDGTAAASPEEDTGPPEVDREACDLQILLGLPEQQKICLISQLVDISDEEETDVTGYLLQKAHTLDEDEPPVGDRSSTLSGDIPSQLVSLLIRIPKGGSFYKLYLYAVPMEENIVGSIPLVFTYLIDAPLRLSAAETPYIGATAGEFPEKIEKREAAEQAAAAGKAAQ